MIVDCAQGSCCFAFFAALYASCHSLSTTPFHTTFKVTLPCQLLPRTFITRTTWRSSFPFTLRDPLLRCSHRTENIEKHVRGQSGSLQVIPSTCQSSVQNSAPLLCVLRHIVVSCFCLVQRLGALTRHEMHSCGLDKNLSFWGC